MTTQNFIIVNFLTFCASENSKIRTTKCRSSRLEVQAVAVGLFDDHWIAHASDLLKRQQLVPVVEKDGIWKS